MIIIVNLKIHEKLYGYLAKKLNVFKYYSADNVNVKLMLLYCNFSNIKNFNHFILSGLK